ncbi:MAG: TonB family protein [Erythrobacter sp.]
MSYASTANRPNPVAALGALGVPAAFGALLVVGLAVKVAIDNEDGRLIGVEVPIDPPKDLPTPEPQPDTAPSNDNTTIPEPDFTPTRPDSPITIVAGPTAPIGTPKVVDGDWTVPLPLPEPVPMPSPAFDPVSASPKGNPGGWITTNDYRPSWINRGYTGVANFALLIDARGRVSGCSITGSTGYSALDEATCRLLERRARFEPAKDSSGNNVAGSYRSSVRWTIPE